MKKMGNYLIGLVLLVSMLVSAVPPAVASPQPAADGLLPKAELSNRETGGPDEFGYIWDDVEAYEWIDAKTNGTNLGLSSSFSVSSAVDIGFDFPFFENSYNQVYVTPAGWLTFDPLPSGFFDYWSKRLLQPPAPNNLIAPYWETLSIGEDGGVYAVQGDSYFVVEWHNMTSGGGTQTFQVILHENGDIVMQYSSMFINVSYPGVVGIEDSRGVYGLQYLKPISNELAIRFTPPKPARRVFLTPLTQSAFANPGMQDFAFTMQNTGTLGDDTYSLSFEGDWGFALFEADGETPIADPITLLQGEAKPFIGRVTVPAGTQVGNYNEFSLTVALTDEPAISKTAVMAFLTPAPFAQILGDGADQASSNYLVTPEGQEKILLPEAVYGDERSIIELPNFSLLTVWNEGVILPNQGGDQVYGYRLFYSIVDRFGNKVVEGRLLSDFSDVVNDIFIEDDLYDVGDKDHFLAVDADGNVGIVWYRYQQTYSSYFNYNIHFAIINEEGEIVLPDTNITREEDFHYYTSNDYITFTSPQIAATENGDFILAWRTETYSEGIPSRRIDSSIVESSSIVEFSYNIGEITEITDSTLNIFDINSLRMTALSGDRIFITWYQLCTSDWERTYTAYKVFAGDGNVIEEEADLGVPVVYDYHQPPPDLAQLSDGTIIMVSWGHSAPVKYLLIDDVTYTPFYDHVFDLLPGFTYAQYPSVTTDMEGHAIITWKSYSAEKGMDHLIYALVSSDGIVSEPFAFYSPGKSSNNKYYLRTSNNRQGNTTYHKNSPPFFTSEPVTSVFQDEEYVYNITADDYDLDIEDSLTFTSADVLPAWLELTDNTDGTGMLTGRPNNGDVGDHPITLVVTDSTNKSKTQSFTITVINVNDPPEFTSTPITTATEGTDYVYVIEVDDPDLIHGDVLTFSWTAKPDWLTLEKTGVGTATLSGTPGSADVGLNPVELMVEDSEEAFDTQSFTIIVAASTEPPQIISDPIITFTVDKLGTFTVETTGKPTPDEITYSGTLPDGVSFTDHNNGTATLAGTPVLGTGGIYEITITASNGVLPNATQAFTLTVATTAVVDVEEGTITSNEGDIEITIPAGAVDGEAIFTFTPQSEPEADTGGFTFAGISFTLTAVDADENPITDFTEPLSITITYDPDALGEIDPMTLMLYKWDGSAWVDAICDGYTYVRDPDNNRFSLHICHLCEFAVLGEVIAEDPGFNIFLPLITR